MAEHWGSTTKNPELTWWQMGDFNGDNKVDAKDAAILAAQWGDHAGGTESASTVPEPGIIAMLFGLALAALRRRIER